MAGVLAVLALTVLVVGVPVALITVLGLPIPHSKPALSLLTHQLSILSLIQILSVIVWLAWLQLVFCVAVEVRAAIRNVGVPARIPLSGGTQAIAHRLVTAALLLFTATASLSPAFASTGPAPRAAHTVSATHLPAGPVQAVLASHETAGLHAAEAAGAAPASHDPDVEKIYIVKPPVGRFHESLWEIAENHLGNGLRYREIFEMNKDRPQPDGTTLTMAALIRPGWVLRMPRDAYGAGIHIVAPGTPGGPAGAAEQAIASQAERATEAATSTRAATSGPTLAPAAGSAAAAERAAASQAEQANQAAAGTAAPAGTHASGRTPEPAVGGQSAPAGSAAAAERAAANQAERANQAAAGTAAPAGTRAPAPGHTAGPVASASSGPASAAERAAASRADHAAQVATPGANGGPVPGGSPGSAAAAERVAADQAERASHAAAGPLPAFPHELAASSLLAAGLLTALGRRRREQLWQRAYGAAVARPEGPAAMAEAALRLGANESAVRVLDTGLRSLSQELAARGKTPPTVFAAHIGQVNLDLWIATADTDPPRPWLAVDDGQVWRLPLTAVADLDPDGAAAPLAPYPGLISIGTSDTGRMLVDLEVAHGLIAVRGPHATVQAVLAAMAVELATNGWSDRMRLTLVGFSPGLQMLAPERITVADTLDEAIPALEAKAAEVEYALGCIQADAVGRVSGQESTVGRVSGQENAVGRVSGQESAAGRVSGQESAAGRVSGQEDTLLTGRSLGLHPDSWAPHYLITAIPPTPHQRERLLTLASTRHRTAMGFVVAGDVPGATWYWDVTEQGRLRAGVFGFDLRAQLLPPQQCAAVVDLFHTAAHPGGVALNDPPPDAVPPAHLVPESPMAVEVGMLGQVSVRAPGGIDAARIGAATEIVAYLAAHPEGVDRNVVTAAIWPRGVAPEVSDAAFARVRDWLGTDGEGRPNLVTDAAGRMRLGPGVRVDWQVFRSLVGHAIRARQAGQDEAAYLSRALKLIRGQLLDGHDWRGYAWLATDPLEYQATAQVADAAHRLCELRLAGGDAEGAMDAARSGLRFAFNDELLWRDLLTAAHATGQEHVLRAVVGEVSARVSLDEVLPRMAPQTEALIDELLPSWRSSVA